MIQGSQDGILNGPLLAALPIALLAGLASFFTPCSLPLMPGYLSYVSGMAGTESEVTRELRGGERARRGRTVLGASLFVLGFALVFASYGLALGSLGDRLLEHQETIWRVSGVLTILLGLLFTGLAGRLPLVRRTLRPDAPQRLGLAGAPLLGVAFGVGWTPCIGPALAAVLTMATTSATASRGALLALTYALGLGIPFVLAALSISTAMRTFSWLRARARWFSIGGGVMLIGVGVLQLTGVWALWVARLQVVISGWQAPL